MARKAPEKRVAELRDEIAQLKTRRREVTTAPVSMDEIETALDEFIARRAEEYRVSRITTPLAQHGRINSLGGDNVERFAAFYFPETIKSRLLSQVEAGDGLTHQEREAQIVEIDKKLFEAECAEEQAIVESEDAGRPIERRPDADTRAVLQTTEGEDE